LRLLGIMDKDGFAQRCTGRLRLAAGLVMVEDSICREGDEERRSDGTLILSFTGPSCAEQGQQTRLR
jgi:hypothetical protein